MTVKKKETPKFEVTVKIVIVVDVTVDADSFSEALAAANAWPSNKLITLDDSCTEADSLVKVLGVRSQEDWGTSA